MGFIAAMWVISFLGFGNSYDQLFVAAIASIILAVFAMFFTGDKATDKTEAKEEVAAFSLSNTLQVFKKKKCGYFRFSFATLLLGSVLQITNTFGVPFLQDMAKAPPNADDSFLGSLSFCFSYHPFLKFLKWSFDSIFTLLLKRVKE